MWMRYAMLVTLTLSLVACGGGDGAEPAAPTGTDGATASAAAATGGGTPQERVEAAFATIVEVCRQEDWAAAARHFVYRGDDDRRKWKDTWDGSDPDERLRAKVGCDELLYGGFPETGSAYALGELTIEEESEGAWYVQEVLFPEVPEADPIYVAFLDIGGQMAVGDVD